MPRASNTSGNYNAGLGPFVEIGTSDDGARLPLPGSFDRLRTRGAAGGYQLTKPPDEITLGEVMQVIEAGDETIRSSAAAESPASRVLIAAWTEVAEVEREMLAAITFAELASRIRRRAENMYYI